MYLEACNEKQLQSIYDEFGVTDESLKKDIEYLKGWMEKEPHLSKIKGEDSEKVMVNILLRNKMSLERAKVQINDFYVLQAISINLFKSHFNGPRTDIVKRAIKFGGYVLLPKLTPEGSRILMFEILDPALLPTTEEILQAMVLLSYLLMLDSHKSFTVVFNANHINMSLLPTFLSLTPKTLIIFKNTCRLRFVKFYILNVSSAFEQVIRLGNSMASAKDRAKLVIWKKKQSDLAEVLPKNVLPKEYGGDERPIEELFKLFERDLCETYGDRINNVDNENDLPRADLSKLRKGNNNSQTNELILGLNGSFRKLNVD